MSIIDNIGSAVSDVGDVISYGTGFNPFTLKVNDDYANALSDITGMKEINSAGDWWNGMSILQRAGYVAAFAGGAAALGPGAAGAGAEGAAGTAAAETTTSQLLGVGNAAQASTLEASLPTIGVDAAGGATTGIESSGAEFLSSGAPASSGVADAAATGATTNAGTTAVTDVGGDTLGNAWEGATADSANQNAALNVVNGGAGAPPSNGGIINSVLEFGQKNPAITGAGLIVGGNLAKGGMDYMAMKEKQKLELENAQKMEEWKRRFAEKGALGVTSPVMAPATPGELRRPDGSAVYGPGGIINTAMVRR